jgi:hypothetical protein
MGGLREDCKRSYSEQVSCIIKLAHICKRRRYIHVCMCDTSSVQITCRAIVGCHVHRDTPLYHTTLLLLYYPLRLYGTSCFDLCECWLFRAAPFVGPSVHAVRTTSLYHWIHLRLCAQYGRAVVKYSLNLSANFRSRLSYIRTYCH